ncbi:MULTISPECIES: ATP-binding protein [Psychrilyobacter]|uniref:ATP-binding protein n=1 Tax=Psychrilyobacter piezotolerans TaxID=2293438 RepID=A0ABX9KHV9_9FUSO|nr:MULTISPECIES: ATP-binding protein [Psychrilyobacter]MCS5421837.1 ATP-binding protein [Psychrilyobacter sp. S5]NDI77565.1 ATP-binding protein [Psychrilyobacter piezotolerans]RDE62924.1 ATP-binding protein [Psychrilyobacter sp. S5]REI41682.1 ATP-binding protein [Psychrilyobacter piezotolerans]
MELLYLWVEKYKTIENQGFNFSPRYCFEFNEGNLTKEERDHLENFFEENIVNITGIFGGNGSGKSTLLEILSTIKNNREAEFNYKYFYIYKDNEKIKLIDSKGIVKEKSEEIQISDKRDFKVKIVHYSDDIDNYNSYFYTNYYNLQSGYLLNRREGVTNYPFVKYSFEDFKKQIDFLSNYRDLIRELPYDDYITSLESIKKINLEISEYNYEKEIHLEDTRIVEKKMEIYDKYIMTIGNLNNASDIKENFFWQRTIKNYWGLLIGAVTEDIYSNRFNEIEIENFKEGTNSLFEWLDNFLKKIKDQVIEYEKKMNNPDSIKFYSSTKSEDVINYFNKLIILIN